MTKAPKNVAHKKRKVVSALVWCAFSFGFITKMNSLTSNCKMSVNSKAVRLFTVLELETFIFNFSHYSEKKGKHKIVIIIYIYNI